MKTNLPMLLLAFWLMLAAGCKKDKEGTYTAPLEIKDHDTAFVHPGLLHTDTDFARMKTKVAASAEPWLSGWNRLTTNSHASLEYVAHPVSIVYRGYDGVNAENITVLPFWGGAYRKAEYLSIIPAGYRHLCGAGDL